MGSWVLTRWRLADLLEEAWLSHVRELGRLMWSNRIYEPLAKMGGATIEFGSDEWMQQQLDADAKLAAAGLTSPEADPSAPAAPSGPTRGESEP